jgi:tRNA(fMet)-specific endonuclease VapC
MKYVLDTNVVSAFMRGDARVVERLRNIARDDLGIPQPVLAELAYGIERLPRSARKRHLHRRLDSIREQTARTPWSDEVSERFGVLKATLEKRGERIEDFDVAIAAHALAHRATLVTANHKPTARRVDEVGEAG